MVFDFASRIAKLDAVSLDKEFLVFLKREVTGLLIAVTGEERLQKFTPEISLFVKFLIWKYTTFSNGRTVGQRLLGIKYAPYNGRLKLLFLLEGVIPYFVERLQSFRNLQQLEVIHEPLKLAQNAFKMLHVLNFCLFLLQNRYPTLATRLLRLPIVPVDPRFNPAAGYLYQIRELLWHQFADLLITILPMINFQKFRRTAVRWMGGDKAEVTESTNTNTPNDQKTVTKCSVCNDNAVIPQKVGKESYCYFCYQAVVVDDKF